MERNEMCPKQFPDDVLIDRCGVRGMRDNALSEIRCFLPPREHAEGVVSKL